MGSAYNPPVFLSLPAMSFCPSRTESLSLRGLRYQVRHWGPVDAPPVFFLHGWMDASPTFQFVVDALQQTWHVIAPDWRGYGGSEYLGRPYWFPDYYADLDALLAHYSPDVPARLVGHSMGGSVAAIYAGLRPERVAQLVVLDFLGLKPPPVEQGMAETLQVWLDGIAAPPRMRSYRDRGQLARWLVAANPRLLPERAEFLAMEMGRPSADGQVELACDPWHKIPAPYPYRIEDVMDCWRRVAAPVLQVVAEQGYVRQRFGDVDAPEFRRRTACFRQLKVETVVDAGHNLQHDQPEAVARLLEDFLERD